MPTEDFLLQGSSQQITQCLMIWIFSKFFLILSLILDGWYDFLDEYLDFLDQLKFSFSGLY